MKNLNLDRHLPLADAGAPGTGLAKSWQSQSVYSLASGFCRRALPPSHPTRLVCPGGLENTPSPPRAGALPVPRHAPHAVLRYFQRSAE